jgi:hypothetical protein
MLTTAVLVAGGSLAAGGLGLYLIGSTGAPSTGIAKTVEDSVSSIADQVTKTAENVTEYVSPKSDDPQPVTPPVQAVKPVVEEKPAEQPVEPVEQPVEQPVVEEKPVEQPVVENRAVAPSLPEVDSMAGGQRGGFGRPTWAPLNSGTSLTQALGIVPGSTAGNVLATVTGSKTPQQIQLKLVEVDRQLRSLNVKAFNLKQNQTDYEEINKDKVPGTKHLGAPSTDLEDDEKPEGWRAPRGDLSFRQRYVEAYNRMFTSKTLLEDVTKEISKYSRDVEPQVKPVNLKEEALKLFPPLPGEKQKGKGMWSERAMKHFNTNPPADFPDLKPRGDELADRGGSGEKWYERISKGSGTGGPDKNKLPNLLRTREKQTSIFQRAESDLEYFKDKYEENAEALTQVKLELQELSKEIKELETTRGALLEELSAYKVPQSMWQTKQAEKKPLLPSGEELNRLMARYKDSEERIKEKQEEIDNYISNHLDDKTGYPLDGQDYVNLTGIPRGAFVAEDGKITMETLKAEREKIIAEIEGRSVKQKEAVQKEIQNVGTWKSMIRSLELDPAKEKKYLDPKIIALYSAFESMLSDEESTIEKNIPRYYDTFSKGYNSSLTTSGLTTLLRTFNMITQDSTGSECKWKAGDEIEFDTDKVTDATTKTAADQKLVNILGENKRIFGKVIRVRNFGDKVKVCTELRIKVTGVNNVNIIAGTTTRTVSGAVDGNVDKEIIIDLSKGTTKYDLAKMGDKKPFDRYKAGQDERLAQFITKIDHINEDVRPGTELKKKLELLKQQLEESAKPYFSTGDITKLSVLSLFGKGPNFIQRIIIYLTTLDLRRMLQMVGSLLFSSLPTFVSKIIEGIKDRSEISKAISDLENLISETAATMGRRYAIPDVQKNQIKEIIRNLRDSTKSLTERRQLARTTKAETIFVGVFNADGTPKMVYLKNDTAADKRLEASASDFREALDGDYTLEVQQNVKTTLGEEMVKYHRTIWSRLKETFGKGIGDGALPNYNYELCGKDEPGAIPFLASLVTGGYVTLYYKKTDISGESDDVRRAAKGSMTSLSLKMLIIDGFITLPSVLLAAIPSAVLYSLYMMVSKSIDYGSKVVAEQKKRVEKSQIDGLKAFNDILPGYLAGRVLIDVVGPEDDIRRVHAELVAEVPAFLNGLGDEFPDDAKRRAFSEISMKRIQLDTYLIPNDPAPGPAPGPAPVPAPVPAPAGPTLFQTIVGMLANLGLAIRRQARGADVVVVAPMLEGRAGPRPEDDAAAAEVARRAAEEAAAAAARAEAEAAAAAEGERAAAEARAEAARAAAERAAAEAAEAERVAAERAAAERAEAERAEAERAEAERVAAAEAAARAPPPGAPPEPDAVPPPGDAGAPPPPPPGAPPPPAPVQQWRFNLALPNIGLYALFDEDSYLYKSLSYIFQAFTVFKTWEFSFETWKIGDKASAEEWDTFFKESKTFVSQRAEIKDATNPDSKGKESGLGNFSITDDEKSFLENNGIKSLQDFNLSILQTTSGVWKTGNNILSKISESTRDIDQIFDKIDTFVDLAGIKIGELGTFVGAISLSGLGFVFGKRDWSALLGAGWENVVNLLGFTVYCGVGFWNGTRWVISSLFTGIKSTGVALGALGYSIAYGIGYGLWYTGRGAYAIGTWVRNSLPELQPILNRLGAGLLFVVTGAGTLARFSYQLSVKALTAIVPTLGRFILNIGVAGRSLVELTKLMLTTVVYGTAIPVWTLLVWGGYGIVFKGIIFNLLVRPIVGTVRIIWQTGKNTAGRLIWKEEDLGQTTNWFKYLNYGKLQQNPAVVEDNVPEDEDNVPEDEDEAAGLLPARGGYTRRHLLRGMPKRAKTRRTY